MVTFVEQNDSLEFWNAIEQWKRLGWLFDLGDEQLPSYGDSNKTL